MFFSGTQSCWYSGEFNCRQGCQEGIKWNNTAISISYTDFKHCARKYSLKMWQDQLDGLEHNKLHSIKPNLGVHKSESGNRKEQEVITRCRIGHSRSTLGFLLVGVPRPGYIPYDCPFSIKHVLLYCVNFANTRKINIDRDNTFDLF